MVLVFNKDMFAWKIKIIMKLEIDGSFTKRRDRFKTPNTGSPPLLRHVPRDVTDSDWTRTSHLFSVPCLCHCRRPIHSISLTWRLAANTVSPTIAQVRSCFNSIRVKLTSFQLFSRSLREAERLELYVLRELGSVLSWQLYKSVNRSCGFLRKSFPFSNTGKLNGKEQSCDCESVVCAKMSSPLGSPKKLKIPGVFANVGLHKKAFEFRIRTNSSGSDSSLSKFAKK